MNVFPSTYEDIGEQSRLYHARRWLWGPLCGLLVLFLSCSQEPKGRGGPQAVVPVVVSAAAEKDVPVEVRAIGTVEAYSTVSIMARVGGELRQVYFKEGQDVQKGGLLFTIDPRPYESVLEEARANLARDKARAKNAQEDARRYDELVNKDYVTKEQYDQILANAEALQATVRADEAALENARLNVGYCSIYAPITGRTGSLLVHPGNLIKANDDKAMLIIHQIQPVYVSFSVPEHYLPEIWKYWGGQALSVTAFPPNTAEGPFQGTLTFVDNAVDGKTGTIVLKATFPNANKALWPGQFVNVVLTLTTRPHAVLVPSQAVQAGQRGDYVFVVKPDLTVESRAVVVGNRLGRELVIEEGLEAGENIVTDGQLRLVPGAKVEVTPGLEGAGEARQ
jgi:multidrug efflux system membrane fusion protein